MTRRSVTLAAVAVAASATALVPVAIGGAAETTTVKVDFIGQGKTFIQDVAPKSPKGPPKLSLGDRLVGVQPVSYGGKKGTLHSEGVITNRRPAGFERFTAIVHAVLHLPEGDIYATGFVDSADAGDRYEIIGGSGAYEGLEGNVDGNERDAVVTLRP